MALSARRRQPGLSRASRRGSMSQHRQRRQTSPTEMRRARDAAAPCACSGPIAVGLALLSAFATFVVLADLTPIAPTHDVVVTLLLVNALTVLLLLGIIGREVWQVVQARRRGRAGARLHVRIVGLFAVDRRGAGDPGGDRRQRHARPRPRPLFSTRTRAVDREFADRRARPICSEHAQIDPRRHHGDGVRRRARQADVRCTTRETLPPVPDRQATVRGLAAAIDARQATSRSSSAPTSRSIRPSPCRRARRSPQRQRQGAAGRHVARHQLRRRRRQAARLRRLPISTSRGRSIRAWSRNCRRHAGERQRISPTSRRAASACRSPSR